MAIVVCALAFTIAVPLRTYLQQQSELSVQRQRQAELEATLDRLRERKSELADPAVIEADARRRLGFVMPGETPYTVQLPGEDASADESTGDNRPGQSGSWYEQLWWTINGTPESSGGSRGGQP